MGHSKNGALALRYPLATEMKRPIDAKIMSPLVAVY